MSRTLLLSLSLGLLAGALILGGLFFLGPGTPSGNSGEAGLGPEGPEEAPALGGTLRGSPTRFGGDDPIGSSRTRSSPDRESGNGQSPAGTPGSLEGPLAVSGSRSQSSGADATENRPGKNGKNGKNGKDEDGEGKRDKPEGTPTLRGEALTQALSGALEEEDLAAIQGLLISSLTRDGTNLGAEDLSALLSVLNEVDDYGLQLLTLTHLERLEADPAALAQGYVDYLFDAKHPAHADEVFSRIAKLGGDPALDGLTEILRENTSSKFRHRAVEALGHLGDSRAVSVLRERLLRLEEPHESRVYMESLARIGGREAMELVVDRAVGSDPYALRALRDARDVESLGVIADHLGPRASMDFQKMALNTLANAREPETLPQLERYLARAPEEMIKSTLSTLGRFRHEGAADVLENFAASVGVESPLGRSALKYAQRVQQSAAREAQQEAERRARQQAKDARNERDPGKKAKKSKRVPS